MKHKNGFTLIELLVVVAIIGLLSSVVLSSLNSARAKARDAQRLSEIRQLQNALALYANDNGGNYPSTNNNASRGSLQVLETALVPRYIPKIPNDPLHSGGYQTWPTNPTTNYYYWDQVGCFNIPPNSSFPYTLWYHTESKENTETVPCAPLPSDKHVFLKHP